ncbi:MAG: serine/threonine-protein kinase, partial [Planctomycetota bacterium]
MTFAQPFADYEILDRVGAGAMGTVFKARHKKLNRIVALKVLKPSLARDVRYVERLRREARIVASLNDPNIVTGYDIGEEGGYHFFVMEFVEGKSLRALLTEWGMFAEEYVRRVARQVGRALDHAYQRGVIHRDVKPGNILIDEAGTVKLTDMGLAKGPADLTLTRDGATVGTPQYISPEQARNPQDVDVRSDLYSLGATLYHMATGIPPFQGSTMAELITNVLNETPVSPLAINPALSEGLSLVIRKLLVKDLRVRYQTPRELLDDLDRIDRSEAPAVDVARLSDDESDRSRWVAKSLLVAALTVLLAVAWWLGMQARDLAIVVPTGDEFLAHLDAELQTLPTPGERFQRLVAVGPAPPPGTATSVEQRKQLAMAELQMALGVVVASLLEEGWPELQTWLCDPAVWPDRARCERERIQPRLRREVGVVLGQMPVNLRPERLEELLSNIDHCLAQRDTDLLVRFDHFLTSTLPAIVEGRIRAGHFAEADQFWRDGVATFCDRVHEPAKERLSDSLVRRVEEKHALAKQAAQSALDTAETERALAMRAEVSAFVDDSSARLRDGLLPEIADERARSFRRDFLQVWPASGRFRIGSADPWSHIEQQLGGLQQQILNAIAQRAEQRFEQRCDLAWRTFCHGSADDALRVLEETTEAPAHLQMALQQQRSALQAARTVAKAMLLGIASSGRTVAFPRGSHLAVELRAEARDDGVHLFSEVSGQPARRAQLSEFRFTNLLTRMRQLGVDPLHSVPRDQLSLGLAVSAMAADDLADVGTLLGELRRPELAFLL